ncbi:MAG: ATP-binding protein [Paludibacter sp.]
MNMITRTIENRIYERMQPNKVMLLFGPRRVGKTVLMRNIINNTPGNHLILNGEDYDTLTLLEPQSIANYRKLLDGIDLLAIDEAQNITDVGKKLKLIVDEVPGIRVIATGSSSFDLQNKAGEPLVGRSSRFQLHPFSQQELGNQENTLSTRQNLEERLIYGAYPELISISNLNRKKEYLRDIINSYLLKDILMIDGVKNSRKMMDLLRLISYQTGSEVSYDELGKHLGLSRNTVERYLDLLSQVFIIYRAGAFSRNLRKEISKGAKWYFYDNGIRNAIVNEFKALQVRNDIGVLWENYLMSERIKLLSNRGDETQHYFWRTYDGQEIDLIEAAGNKVSAFEFKWGDKHKKAPRAFADNYTDATYQVINQQNYLDFIT